MSVPLVRLLQCHCWKWGLTRLLHCFYNFKSLHIKTQYPSLHLLISPFVIHLLLKLKISFPYKHYSTLIYIAKPYSSYLPKQLIFPLHWSRIIKSIYLASYFCLINKLTNFSKYLFIFVINENFKKKWSQNRTLRYLTYNLYPTWFVYI